MTWVRLTWETRLRHHTQQPADNKSLQDARLIFHSGCVQEHSRYCWKIHKIYQWILTHPRHWKDLRNNNQYISPGWPMGWQHHPSLSLSIEVVCPPKVITWLFAGLNFMPHILQYKQQIVIFHMCKRGFCCRPVSVRPSVCHVHVQYPDGWSYRQTSFSAR